MTEVSMVVIIPMNATRTEVPATASSRVDVPEVTDWMEERRELTEVILMLCRTPPSARWSPR